MPFAEEVLFYGEDLLYVQMVKIQQSEEESFGGIGICCHFIKQRANHHSRTRTPLPRLFSLFVFGSPVPPLEHLRTPHFKNHCCNWQTKQDWPDCSLCVLEDGRSKELRHTNQTDAIHLHNLIIHLDPGTEHDEVFNVKMTKNNLDFRCLIKQLLMYS